MMSSRQHRLDKNLLSLLKDQLQEILNQKYNKMIGKKIILEVLDIVAEVTGGDKTQLTRRKLKRDNDELNQLKTVLYFILRYDFGFQAGFITDTLGVPSYAPSRHGNWSDPNPDYLEKVREIINNNGLLNKK